MTKFLNPIIPITYSAQLSQLAQVDKDLRDLKAIVVGLINNLNAILDAGIDFDDNVDCVFVSYTTNAAPNTQDTVAHALGKIPVGFIVVDIDKAGVIYRSGASTNASLFLKCSVASATVTLLIF